MRHPFVAGYSKAAVAFGRFPNRRNLVRLVIASVKLAVLKKGV